MKLKSILSCLLATPVVCALFAPQARAGSFTAGNVVVTQYGTGAATLSSAASQLYIVEYLPSTPHQATPVQIIAIPTNGANELTIAGNAGVEGEITRSLNSSNLDFGGYQDPPGTLAVASSLTTNGLNSRIVGQLDGFGDFTTTAGGSIAFDGANIRAVISDGTNFWESGTGGSTTTNGGVWYSAAGAPPIIITNGNLRDVAIFNSKLYYSTESGALHSGINLITNSTPGAIPTTKAAGNLVVPENGAAFAFVFNPAGNVCYVADSTAGIEKWAFTNGTTWTESFVFNTNNGVGAPTFGCEGVAVDFSGANPVIYATTSEPTNRLLVITDTSSFMSTNDTVDQATTLASAPGTNTTVSFRGVALAPLNPSTDAPSNASISPLVETNFAGLPVSLTASASGGTPFTFYWYEELPGVSTNLVQSGSSGVLSYPVSTIGESGFYQVVVSNSFSTVTATSEVAQLEIVPGNPNNLTISPSNNIVENAGQNIQFTSTVSGSPPFSYFWYEATATATNLLPTATNSFLTISNAVLANSGGFFVVVSNAFAPPATSSIVSVTITNDPIIEVQPANSYGLLGGQVQFAVTAFGTAPLAYQWWFSDPSGNLIAQVGTGNDFGDAATVSGGTTPILTISDVQNADLTNFVVVVTNINGAVTSSVASLEGVSTGPTSDGAADTADTILAFWDFNGTAFTNNAVYLNALATPAPYLGVGSASIVGIATPFVATTTADPNDGEGFADIIPGVDHEPNWAWGTQAYPLTGTNKANGIQFLVSTRGAKNIKLTYESRVSATASDFERVQYTINGTNWIDYPSSSSFNGVSGVGAGGWLPFANDFTGFPGVANNTNFGIRIVTEYESTASYGVGTTNNWVGTANSYASGAVGNAAAGTVTYDLVGIYGDAITNNNVPPTISPFTNAANQSLIISNEVTLDSVPVTNTFVVSGDSNATNFLYSAQSLNPSGPFGVLPSSITFSPNSNGVVTMVITPSGIAPNVAAAPILVTVIDTNGDSTVGSFILTVDTQFPSPTVAGLFGTNTLINTTLPIAFMVSSPTDSVHQFSYSASSANNTLVPSASIVVTTNNPGTPTNPVVTITPANGQLGLGILSVTVNDNDATEQKSTIDTFPFMVRPNTNIVAIDYFTYDNLSEANTPLDTTSDGFWQHLSGIFHQMQVFGSPSGGVVTVDTLNNTENLQIPLIGQPYSANILYYSMIVSMNSPGNMPLLNGTYFAAFNDGSGATADVEDCLVVATNGAAPGNFRLGISDDVGANATNGDTIMFPQDLVQGSNYVVVTALNLATGQSTLWINPISTSSPSVTAIPDGNTTVFSIEDFELRESGGAGGAVSVGDVKVGTTFLVGPQISSSVTSGVPFGAPYQIAITNLAAAAGWSDPNGLPLVLASVGPTSVNGTNVTSDGTTIHYGGAVTSPDSFNYVISDGSLTATGSVFLTIVEAQVTSSTVAKNANGNPTFSGTGAANFVYGVEDSTNLLAHHWFEAGNVLVSSTNSWSFTDVNQTNPPAIFYRIYYPDNPASPPQ
jgi:hypothetical protein